MVNNMKRIFFFLLLFLLPIVCYADSITKLEVTNGILSPHFEKNNNVYSVKLNEGEISLKYTIELKDSNALVTISNNQYEEDSENKVVLSVLNSDQTKEDYIFYLTKEESTSVFHEVSKEEPKVIPHLKLYLGGCWFLVMVFLFKCIILGFKKK